MDQRVAHGLQSQARSTTPTEHHPLLKLPQLLHLHLHFTNLRELHHGLHHSQHSSPRLRVESDGPLTHALHGDIKPGVHGDLHRGVYDQVVRHAV